MSQSGATDDDRPRAGLANIFLYQPSGRAQRPPWLPGVVTRYTPAISCILIPFAVLIFYQKTVDQVRYHIKIPAAVILNSEYTDCPLPDADKAFEDQAGRRPEVLSIGRQSDDVSGRYGFGTTSAALQMLALAGIWGLGSSCVLLGALLPSYFSWSRDVENWAATKSVANATEKDRETLIASEGLDFAPTASASALLTVAIPALSGPLLELLKSIPGLAGH